MLTERDKLFKKLPETAFYKLFLKKVAEKFGHINPKQ